MPLISVDEAAKEGENWMASKRTQPGLPKVSKLTVGAWALPMGFYEGMLGSGNSLVASLLFCVGRGYDLITALGHYYLLAFTWCALAAAAYIGQGHYDVGLMVPATVGSCVGGYLGSRVAGERGSRFVRTVFVVAGAFLGLKLLLGL